MLIADDWLLRLPERAHTYVFLDHHSHPTFFWLLSDRGVRDLVGEPRRAVRRAIGLRHVNRRHASDKVASRA